MKVLKRLSIINKLNSFILNTIAYLILEPMLLYGKWKIREDARRRLTTNLKKIIAIYDDAQAFFKQIDMCSTCTAPSCCTGAYNRFTVYDHISHLVAGLKDPPNWGYRLHPTSSYAINRIDKGICLFLIEGTGCSLDFHIRPALCVWEINCTPMQLQLNNEEKRFAENIRVRIQRAYWTYVRVLLLGGLERVEEEIQ